MIFAIKIVDVLHSGYLSNAQNVSGTVKSRFQQIDFFPTFNPTANWTSGTSYYSDYFVLCLERCKLICCRQDLR